MKKILSILLAFSLFLNIYGEALAQSTSPSAALKTPKATVSATLAVKEISAVKTPAATTKAAKKTSSPTGVPVTANSVLTSMPKASFVILLLVLLFLAIELIILKKKKSEEKVERVTPETFKETAPGDKKTKAILTILILVFILIAIPLTLILVKQRQEVRKKALEPTVCCEVWAKNLCGPEGYGSFDMKVAEFATEAQCNAYKQAGAAYSYSCNCNLYCMSTGVGCDPNKPPSYDCNNHDANQTCQGSPVECNNLCGKSRCTSSGSDNFEVRIVNQAACGGVTTPAPTPAPTPPPTTAPTAQPTTRPTNPPTTAPTPPPTTAPTAQPTTRPTNPPTTLSCNQGPCNATGVSCASGLVCAADYGYVCRKSECQIQADCTCKTALSCNQGPCNVANSGCGSGLSCIHDTWFGHDQWVCRNNDCQIESDCVCKQAVSTPAPPPVGAPGQAAKPYVPVANVPAAVQTPPPPVIPQAGIDGPTFMTVAAGALLLIAGFALAL